MECPDHVNCMEVYLSNQCNMRCPQCCVDIADKAADIVRLSWEELRGAIDYFMDPKEVPFSAQKYIVFAGGETFLDYPLLLKAAKHCRRFSVRPQLFIYTNGTCVKPQWVRELTALNAMIIFSVDGYKEENDAYRKFAGGGKSAWEAVTRNIEKLPKENCGTNSVLRPGNLGGMIKAFDTFSKMGFKSVDFWPDYFQTWAAGDLKKLKGFMKEFADYYARRTLKDGAIPFHVPMLHHALVNAGALKRNEVWWRECFRLILAADGSFYDCQGVMHFRHECKDGPSVIGRALGGVDWAKRQKYMDAADRYLKIVGAEADWQHVCPRLYYKIAKGKGADPAPLNHHLHEVSAVLLKGFLAAAKRLEKNASFREEYIDKLPVPATVREVMPAAA